MYHRGTPLKNWQFTQWFYILHYVRTVEMNKMRSFPYNTFLCLKFSLDAFKYQQHAFLFFEKLKNTNKFKGEVIYAIVYKETDFKSYF